MIWTMRSESGRPLTTNAIVNLHRQQWAKRTKEYRGEWWALALEAKIPKNVGPITVIATPLHKDRRSPQDVAACAPGVKAAIDGLVDAGVIPDDNPEHLYAVTFRPPLINGVDGLELVVLSARELGVLR